MKNHYSFPDNNPFPVIEINYNGNITYMNPAAKKIFPNLESSGIKHPFLAGILQTIKSTKNNYEICELLIEKRYYEQIIIKVESIKKIRVYSHDITESKIFQIALNKRTKELEASNRELKAFSYSISHDLRTPIRSIDGYAAILINEYSGKLDSTARRYLNNIRQSGLKISTLIDDLQRLFKISTSEYKPKKCNLSLMVESIAESLKQTQPDRNAKFLINDNISTNCDESLIKIALTNLIENAWKFTSKNKNTRIEFGTGIINGKKTYFIKDNGIGFDMKYADKIFVPFNRLHNNNDISGTGIGLSIVERIIKRHGGSIWAESNPGIETIFYFTINI
jgi:light-regulated signal transduction histidine kinase (bacteriophytochrome)